MSKQRARSDEPLDARQAGGTADGEAGLPQAVPAAVPAVPGAESDGERQVLSSESAIAEAGEPAEAAAPGIEEAGEQPTASDAPAPGAEGTRPPAAGEPQAQDGSSETAEQPPDVGPSPAAALDTEPGAPTTVEAGPGAASEPGASGSPAVELAAVQTEAAAPAAQALPGAPAPALERAAEQPLAEPVPDAAAEKAGPAAEAPIEAPAEPASGEQTAEADGGAPSGGQPLPPEAPGEAPAEADGGTPGGEEPLPAEAPAEAPAEQAPGEPPAVAAPPAEADGEPPRGEQPLPPEAPIEAPAEADGEPPRGEEPLPAEAPAEAAAETAPGELPAVVAEQAGPVAMEMVPARAEGEAGEIEPPAEGDPNVSAAALGAAPGGPAAMALAGPVLVAQAESGPLAPEPDHALELEKKKRRRLLLALGGLVLLLIVTGALFGRYLSRREPLPEMLPLPVQINYQPHYLFSIHGLDLPVGVAVSPDGERIYVAETGGRREVKILDRDGTPLGSLAPPGTEPAERAPVYVAVDAAGRVFVTDRLQRAVFVYGSDGSLLDAILGPDLTMSEYLAAQVGEVPPDGVLSFNRFDGTLLYRTASRDEGALPAPDPAGWAPLGVRLDGGGTLLLTNVAEGQHLVAAFSPEQIAAARWQQFDPPGVVFGRQGQESDQLLFPNSAVADSQGRIYVTDGNNGRISVWDALGTFQFTFGRGVGEGALSLPRGAAMDGRDRLHVVDTVQQAVKVYDVSGPEPEFLYAFGDWGTEDGQFNYPGDIALDRTGRLYIADRKNNRVQVWSY